MDRQNQTQSMGSVQRNTISSRWNPTKDQISILEELFKQGVRTPSTDQIQQITGRLRAYGHIECKNVFYWFQNHKARQRQKQKQEGIAYFSRLLHKTARFFSPPVCSNVACGTPQYIQQQGDYHGAITQPNKSSTAGGSRKRTSTDLTELDTSPRLSGSARFALDDHPNLDHRHEGMNVHSHDDSGVTSPKTLPLFPLQPSVALQDVAGVDSYGFAPPHEFPASVIGGGGGEPPYYDFFAGPSGSGGGGNALQQGN